MNDQPNLSGSLLPCLLTNVQVPKTFATPKILLIFSIQKYKETSVTY